MDNFKENYVSRNGAINVEKEVEKMTKVSSKILQNFFSYLQIEVANSSYRIVYLLYV